jgi:hypothetical protein
LAWSVNDTATAEIRAQLADLAPRFIGTATGNPLTAPTVVVGCCAAARFCLSPRAARSLDRARSHAEARMRRVSGRKPSRRRRGDRLYRQLYAGPALRAAVRFVAKREPNALPHLLRAGLASVEQLDRGGDLLEPTLLRVEAQGWPSGATAAGSPAGESGRT